MITTAVLLSPLNSSSNNRNNNSLSPFDYHHAAEQVSSISENVLGFPSFTLSELASGLA